MSSRFAWRASFRGAGVTLQMLRKVVAYLRARDGLSATEVLARTNLVTDGERVYEVEGDVWNPASERTANDERHNRSARPARQRSSTQGARAPARCLAACNRATREGRHELADRTKQSGRACHRANGGWFDPAGSTPFEVSPPRRGRAYGNVLPLAREWRRLLARRTCALDRKVADRSSCAPTRVLTDARPKRASRRLAARYAGFLRVERVSAFGVSDGHFYRLSVLARAASGVTARMPNELATYSPTRGHRSARLTELQHVNFLLLTVILTNQPGRLFRQKGSRPTNEGKASRRDTLGFADWLGISRTSANAAVHPPERRGPALGPHVRGGGRPPLRYERASANQHHRVSRQRRDHRAALRPRRLQGLAAPLLGPPVDPLRCWTVRRFRFRTVF